MNKEQCRYASAHSRGRWRWLSLLVAHCSLLIAVAACGGGGNNAANGPAIADLGGERLPDSGPSVPAFDATGAPTDTHRTLAGLLPLDSLVRDSVLYDGWNDSKANLSNEDPKTTALPAVSAEYHSAGFKINAEDPKRADVNYPQRCVLTLIRAPEAMAADAIANNLSAAIVAKGFAAQDALAIGQTRTGEKPTIDRYVRIDTQGGVDNVYVAYIKVIGTLVVYALEIETPPALVGPGGEQIKRVLDGQRGSRVGAQLITLIYHQLNP